MRTSVYLLVHLFLYTDPATAEIYTLSLHDALPIYPDRPVRRPLRRRALEVGAIGEAPVRVCLLRDVGELRDLRVATRSEEHTSELQSRRDLVCRLLLEKKKKKK